MKPNSILRFDESIFGVKISIATEERKAFIRVSREKEIAQSNKISCFLFANNENALADARLHILQTFLRLSDSCSQ